MHLPRVFLFAAIIGEGVLRAHPRQRKRFMRALQAGGRRAYQ
jgi:hypothetical protein